MVGSSCAVDGCERPVFTKKSGWCQSHYLSAKRNGGTPKAQIRKFESPEEKIERLVSLGFESIANYPGSKKPWKCRCPKGHEVFILYERLDENVEPCRSCRVPSLAETHPELLVYWDHKVNSPLTPADVSRGSEVVVTWKCGKGHSPRAPVYSVVQTGPRCGVCTGHQVEAGVNDLASMHKDLLEFWDPARNLEQPATVYGGSQKRFFWQCVLGHSFKSSPWDLRRSRLRGNSGCRFCANRDVWPGFNDLEKVSKILANEFQNGGNSVPPRSVCAFTTKKYRWKCDQLEHLVWEDSPQNRVRRGSYCPKCTAKNVSIRAGSLKKTVPGVNDAATANPLLLELWSSKENGHSSLLNQIPVSSSESYRWRCLEFEHTYFASVTNAVKGVTCGVCSNRELLVGFNDLASSALIHEFDLSSTLASGEEFGWVAEELDPSQIMRSEKRRVWWRCSVSENHSWNTVLSARFVNKSGCPYCAGNRVERGKNDLETKFPELAQEWSSKNQLSAGDVAVRSHTKVWWACLTDGRHPDYLASPGSRTGVNSTGCPDCNTGGFETSKPAYLYFIANFEFAAYKIGISNLDSRPNRLKVWKERGWLEIQTWSDDYGAVVRRAEQRTLRPFLREELGLKPILSKADMGGSGNKETFDMIPNLDGAVISKIEENLAEARTFYSDRTRD